MKVKVCGITRSEDAVLAVELGADLLGLNFWPGSPRALDLERGREIADAVRGRALLVGVFVDQQVSFVARTLDRVGLDLLQLHGDESPAEAAAFPGRAIKAFRAGSGFDPAAATPFADCWGFLLDAAHPTAYGGSGTAWAWERAAGLLPGRRLLLAGGIGPGRVQALAARWRGDGRRGGGDPGASAATSTPPLTHDGDDRLAAPRLTRRPVSPPGGGARSRERAEGGSLPSPGAAAAGELPWGIDVCSGVERAPGIKDEARLRALFAEVRDVAIAPVA